MKELAICIQNENENVTFLKTFEAIKNTDFKNVFIQWYNEDWETSQEEQLQLIRKCNLSIIFAHLGYQNINDLWKDNEAGNMLVERYKNDIKTCSQNNIKMVIIHVTNGKKPPTYNEIGLNRIKKLAEYAKNLGVKIAFENNEVKGYLEYIIENIKNDNIGICFDSGHYHAFMNDELEFSKFKDRIFAVHLHDNDQSRDLHSIPFDGTLNWNEVIKNLKEANYTGPITLESIYRNQYLKININEFYKKCYKAAQELSKMWEES